ncbi:MauE/DoxX family redox-associated membrane protein [Micromonospora sp. NBC_01796]|uniref:MauE/DoxX family redox-associated membrane protein n=1 Tax=Micromonospora sp. NBC_01796 TaxID=2975987 RepID=UPI002DDBF0F6|nr:MauE/DoxX family redox-associated membrane protein [Micromonospora sp. NBC_01796]WSA87318.1 DoxX family membrane protein [Micromonospora sp. NBC_01796]
MTMVTSARARWDPVQPWLGLAVRLGLAAVWFWAGSTKVGDLAAAGRAVNAYQIFSFDVSRVIGAAQPFVEIALGVLLLLGLATRLAAGVSALLLVLFIAGIASAWARGLAIDCGCFSEGGPLAVGQTPSYLPEILRDIGFLIMAAFLLRWPPSPLSIDRWMAGGQRLEDEDE